MYKPMMKSWRQISDRGHGSYVTFLVAAVFLLSVNYSLIQAQIPDSFENLKVLPKDIKKSELVGMMKRFTSALGLRCVNCHVGDASKGFSSFDFASDEKELKSKARFMINMVEQINSDHLAKFDTSGREKVKVECVTCHRGQVRPILIGDTLMSAYANGGIGAVLAEFKSLREKHYGSHTYDFGERVLSRIASQLQLSGDIPAAIQVLGLNAEYFPESSMNFSQIAFAYLDMGDTTSAVKNLESAIQYSPDEPWFKDRLAELKDN